jgi:hypothetical protein
MSSDSSSVASVKTWFLDSVSDGQLTALIGADIRGIPNDRKDKLTVDEFRSRRDRFAEDHKNLQDELTKVIEYSVYRNSLGQHVEFISKLGFLIKESNLATWDADFQAGLTKYKPDEVRQLADVEIGNVPTKELLLEQYNRIREFANAPTPEFFVAQKSSAQKAAPARVSTHSISSSMLAHSLRPHASTINTNAQVQPKVTLAENLAQVDSSAQDGHSSRFGNVTQVLNSTPVSKFAPFHDFNHVDDFTPVDDFALANTFAILGKFPTQGNNTPHGPKGSLAVAHLIPAMSPMMNSSGPFSASSLGQIMVSPPLYDQAQFHTGIQNYPYSIMPTTKSAPKRKRKSKSSVSLSGSPSKVQKPHYNSTASPTKPIDYQQYHTAVVGNTPQHSCASPIQQQSAQQSQRSAYYTQEQLKLLNVQQRPVIRSPTQQPSAQEPQVTMRVPSAEEILNDVPPYSLPYAHNGALWMKAKYWLHDEYLPINISNANAKYIGNEKLLIGGNRVMTLAQMAKASLLSYAPNHHLCPSETLERYLSMLGKERPVEVSQLRARQTQMQIRQQAAQQIRRQAQMLQAPQTPLQKGVVIQSSNAFGSPSSAICGGGVQTAPQEGNAVQSNCFFGPPATAVYGRGGQTPSPNGNAVQCNIVDPSTTSFYDGNGQALLGANIAPFCNVFDPSASAFYSHGGQVVLGANAAQFGNIFDSVSTVFGGGSLQTPSEINVIQSSNAFITPINEPDSSPETNSTQSSELINTPPTELFSAVDFIADQSTNLINSPPIGFCGGGGFGLPSDNVDSLFGDPMETNSFFFEDETANHFDGFE